MLHAPRLDRVSARSSFLPSDSGRLPSLGASQAPCTISEHLQRGKACLSCRRRKMRCDGARPVCTQCIKGNREADCEYTDHQGRTRTQVLEENVARLQARIRELENPDASSPSILLYHPYESTRRESVEASQPLLAQTLSPVVPLRPGSVPAVLSWWEFEEPPTQISNMLIHQFLPHARQLGFALNIPRFLALLDLPTLHPSRPHPALLHAIYLWALHLSQTDDLMQHENLYLQRAVLALQDALGSGSTAFLLDGSVTATKRIHAMQAEVLLSQYFFCLGRFLEGRYHANAAVSLVISCGLHKIRPEASEPHPVASQMGAAVNLGFSSNVSGGLFELSIPIDSVDLGERINIFWSVYNIDKCWSVAVNSPSILVDDAALGTQIDTPWPLDVESYERDSVNMNIPPVLDSTQTVQRFLTGQSIESQNIGDSYAALRAKASSLFERASRLAASWNPVSSQIQARAAIQSDMQRLSGAITNFARRLVPLDRLEEIIQSDDARRTLLVVHTLAHGAMIMLHNVRAAVATEGDFNSANICLVHAGEILRILERINDGITGTLDPIVGSVWMAAAKVFIQDLGRLSQGQRTQANISRRQALKISIERLSTALESIRMRSPMTYQVVKILELLQNLEI